MQKITPFLWFNENAEEAVDFYKSVFKDVKVNKTVRYPDAMPVLGGKVLTIEFELFGQKYVALNGGPKFQFTEAVSFVVNCEGQEEVDYYWEKLTDGGEESMCGWLKDRFGLSWQVVPTVLPKLLAGKDAESSNRVMQAMFKMRKLEIVPLQQAYEGEAVA